MQIVWNGTPYPHGWQFGIAGPNEALFVAGGAVIGIFVLNLCDADSYSLMPERTSTTLMAQRTTYGLMPERTSAPFCENES